MVSTPKLQHLQRLFYDDGRAVPVDSTSPAFDTGFPQTNSESSLVCGAYERLFSNCASFLHVLEMLEERTCVVEAIPKQRHLRGIDGEVRGIRGYGPHIPHMLSMHSV